MSFSPNHAAGNFGEGLVESEYGGGFLRSSGDQLEEQICALNIYGKIADLANYEHPVLGKDLEFVWQTVLKMGFLGCSMSWWQLT